MNSKEVYNDSFHVSEPISNMRINKAIEDKIINDKISVQSKSAIVTKVTKVTVEELDNERYVRFGGLVNFSFFTFVTNLIFHLVQQLIMYRQHSRARNSMNQETKL